MIFQLGLTAILKASIAQVLAARVRPAAVPSYEILHATAGTTAAKLQQMRTAKEDALLAVRLALRPCS